MPVLFRLERLALPFGSVMTMEQFICMTDGFTKKRVLPEPLPPMTTIFLFLAYFGCFGLLSMVSASVAVNGMFIHESSDI